MSEEFSWAKILSAMSEMHGLEPGFTLRSACLKILVRELQVEWSNLKFELSRVSVCCVLNSRKIKVTSGGSSFEV